MTTALENALSALLVIVVGLIFLAAGLGGALYQLEHQPINAKLVGAFIGLAILGALLLPSVFTSLFPRVQKIYLLIFPNGIPMFGGRRASDPPDDKGVG